MIPNRQNAILVHIEKLVHAMIICPSCWLPVNVLVSIQYHFMIACKTAQYAYVNEQVFINRNLRPYPPYLEIRDDGP